MRLIKFLTFCFITVILYSCNNQLPKQSYSLEKDTTSYTFLTHNEVRNSNKNSVLKNFEIDSISEIEKIKLISLIDNRFKDTILIKDYKKQIVIIRNKQNNKIAFVNCFCNQLIMEDDSWKKYLFTADDGGRCFFHFWININEHRFYDLKFNSGIKTSELNSKICVNCTNF